MMVPVPAPPELAVPMVRPVLPDRLTVALAPKELLAVAATLPTVTLPPLSWTLMLPLLVVRAPVAILPLLALTLMAPLLAVMVPVLMPPRPLTVTKPPTRLPTLTVPELLPASMVRPP